MALHYHIPSLLPVIKVKASMLGEKYKIIPNTEVPNSSQMGEIKRKVIYAGLVTD